MRTAILNFLPIVVLLSLTGCGPETGIQGKQHGVQEHKTPVVLTDANFEEHVLRSSQPVLVDFWAAWCQPCLEMKPMIRELAEEYAGRVTVAELNIEDNPFTTAKYEIDSLPTLLVFQDEEPVERVHGRRTKGELVRLLDSVLTQAERRPDPALPPK